ncbi:hypothetical protein [Xylocopilactobacillus apicola]|uniref:Rod shape-determining protein MreD n=1 Tax=Xylocopilactobacillus apicola TaxID=2932184 RepID=A0AAU9D0S8_9LACO|nr:hypothetical protein [Xylocopilactobacillus apicola]BDR58296.1 hypothetical protein XA3_07370 [Xylocopilactobacillus apicola]
MSRKLIFKISALAFIFLYILVLLDGAVSFISRSFPWVMAERISWVGALAGLTILTFEINFNFFWVALIIGLVEDLFYSGIVGFYAISYVFAAIFLRWLVNHLPNNFIYIISSFFLSMTLFCTIYYLLNSYLRLTDVMLLQYISLYLPVTLFTNLIYFVILYLPMIKIVEYYQKKLELKNER